jgi:hypothetical protein
MDAATLKRIRPAADTTAAIRASIDLVAEERREAERRLAENSAQQASLMLIGTAAEIRAAETFTRDAQVEIQQFDLLAAELKRRLAEAAAVEAGLRRAQQVREATALIETFNRWMATSYTPAALIIAEGVEFERLALRAIEGLRDPVTRTHAADLPPISRAFVRNDARGLASLVRLPAATPGPAIVWP